MHSAFHYHSSRTGGHIQVLMYLENGSVEVHPDTMLPSQAVSQLAALMMQLQHG